LLQRHVDELAATVRQAEANVEGLATRWTNFRAECEGLLEELAHQSDVLETRRKRLSAKESAAKRGQDAEPEVDPITALRRTARANGLPV
jgi:hypothetical protein